MASRIQNACSFLMSNRRAVYVLVIATLTYLVNHLAASLLIATNISMANEIHYGQRRCTVGNEMMVQLMMQLNLSFNNFNESIRESSAEEFCNVNQNFEEDSAAGETSCRWHYTGLGWEYQLLAGPLYVVIFSISGIPLGLIAELNNISRKVVLGLCCMLWAVVTVLGGLCTTYWQVVVVRMLLGIAAAGCQPFCGSIISDLFPKDRGAALGFLNFGIYIGYSLTFVLIVAEKQLGWRAVYFIAGSPSFALALLIWITVPEPPRTNTSSVKPASGMTRLTGGLRSACHQFLDPMLILLSLGGAIRGSASATWASNIVQFFKEYHPETNIEDWMSWIPLVFGSVGAFGGGYLSDRLSRDRGIRGRLLVLIACCLASAPFNVGTLYLPMPWAFISHMPAYVFGEMWIGACVAVVVDLVPPDLTASAIAIFFFVMRIIGGNVNVIVTPLTDALNFRMALLITYPSFYVIAALIFSACLALQLCRTSEDAKKSANIEEHKYSFTEKDEHVPFDERLSMLTFKEASHSDVFSISDK